MKVMAILAHDDAKSLNASIFHSVVKHMEKIGINVDILNLYDYADEIPFYYTDKEKFEKTSFFQDNKKRFMEADGLLIVYPVYWYSCPGILKCWIDLITNFAWKYNGGTHAKPLHKIKRAVVINSSMAPVWFRRIITGDLSCRQICEFFKWIGIPRSYFYRIGFTKKITQKKVDKYISEINKLVDRTFNEKLFK